MDYTNKAHNGSIQQLIQCQYPSVAFTQASNLEISLIIIIDTDSCPAIEVQIILQV